MSWVRVFILLLFCVAGPALGGDRATPSSAPMHTLDLLDVGAPSFTNFSPRDGLPNTVITAIQTDREGFVWAASPAGVFRYDGHHWMASSDPAMAHDADSLYLDSHGTLWAAFRNHALAHYDGAHWYVENNSTGLPSVQIRRFAETVDEKGHSTLWR